MDDKRPTREVVYLTDTDYEKPNPGETVLAISLGGKLCEVVWNSKSHEHFHAWMPYPKVPKVVKMKLYELHMDGGWKRSGNGPESTGNE